MRVRLTNNAASLLQNDVRAEDTKIVIAVDDAELFPTISNDDWFPLVITATDGREEIVHVISRNNNVLTVKRGCENTSAQNFAANSRVDLRLTSEIMESMLRLYYGPRTTPPENAPCGALYLDCSKTPNESKVMTDYGWETTHSSLFGQHVFMPYVSKGETGPYSLDQYYSGIASYISVNGKILYHGHGCTIDGNKRTFTLDVAPKSGALIIFHGYKSLLTESRVSIGEFEGRKDFVYAEIHTTHMQIWNQINSIINGSWIVSAPYLSANSTANVQPLSTMALTDKVANKATTQPTNQELLTKAAQLRWQRQMSGIEVDGLHIATDLSSQSLIQGARLAADNDPKFSFQWKTPSGFVTLDATQITKISNAVIAHMAACLDLEATLARYIEQGTIMTFEQLQARFDALQHHASTREK